MLQVSSLPTTICHHAQRRRAHCHPVKEGARQSHQTTGAATGQSSEVISILSSLFGYALYREPDQGVIEVCREDSGGQATSHGGAATHK